MIYYFCNGSKLQKASSPAKSAKKKPGKKRAAVIISDTSKPAQHWTPAQKRARALFKRRSAWIKKNRRDGEDQKSVWARAKRAIPG